MSALVGKFHRNTRRSYFKAIHLSKITFASFTDVGSGQAPTSSADAEDYLENPNQASNYR